MSVIEADRAAPPISESADAAGPVRAPESGRRSRRRAARPAPRPLPPRAPRPAMPDRVSVVVTALMLVAALAFWFLLQVLVIGGLAQSRAQSILHADLREQLAAQTAPTGGAITPGAPVALLSIPTLGLQQVVVEGTSAGDLMSGPGHRRDTVLPGQAGISIVYGRSAAYGAPFRTVTQLRAGDGITVTTAQGEHVYRVDRVRREGDPLPTALEAGAGRLTLVTSEGQGPLAAIAPDHSVYVDATLVGEAAVGPGGRPAGVPEAEKAFAGDPGVLPVLALALQGLLVAVGGTTIRAKI